MSGLSGKVALITGACSGIGAATAVEFASRGARLALTGQHDDNLRKVAEQCTRQPGAEKPFTIIGDLTIETDVVNIFEATMKEFGTLNILVNCAGIGAFGSIETTTLEQFDAMMRINTRAIFHLTMLSVPYLIKTKGAIVNVSSVNGMRSFPGVLAYCMSKSAQDQFTTCVALELAAKGVRVNSVNPGVIVTESHRRAGLPEDEYQKFLERSKTTHPLGRVGQPEEVAKTIAFLASDDASFITGVHVPVDGGRHAACPR